MNYSFIYYKIKVSFDLILISIMLLLPVAPRIDRRNLRDVELSTGSTLKMDANIIGEPPPTVEWRVNGGTMR